LSTTTTTTSDISNATDLSNATKVAGVLEVELDVKSDISHQVVQHMFKKAIAAAVDLPIELVTAELTLTTAKNISLAEANGSSELAQSSGARRLQAFQTRWYEIAYELVITADMDVDAIIEKANRIAVPGSEESQLFRNIMMATEGVQRVGEITSKVPASKIGATTAAPSGPAAEDGSSNNSWKSVAIGLSVAVVVIACLIVSAVLYKRKVVSSGAERDNLADLESGELNAVNPPSQAVSDRVEEAKPIKEVQPMLVDTTPRDVKDNVEESRQPGKEVKAPLVDTNASTSPRAEQSAVAQELVVDMPATRGSPQPSRGLVSL
jgi:hypothetical protein